MRLILLPALIGAFVLSVEVAAGPAPGAAPGTLSVDQALELMGAELMPATPLDAACCKRCSKGKACGDSCISRDKRCTKGVGCACDG